MTASEKWLNTCSRYSARLLGNRRDDIIVASGTVFNVVLLWKLNGAVDEQTKRTRVNLSLKGHAVSRLLL